MPARILIADDHEVVRQGVRAMILRSRPQWEICGDAANGDEALQAIQALKPDVAVLDITMPGMSGLEVAYEVNRRHLPTALLMFTMHESSRLVGEIREAGAQGFVSKSCAGRDLLPQLRRSWRAARSMVRPFKMTRPRRAVGPTPDSLSVGSFLCSRLLCCRPDFSPGRVFSLAAQTPLSVRFYCMANSVYLSRILAR